MLNENYWNDVEDEFDGGILDDVTEVVDWLQDNKPRNENELHELMDLLETNEDRHGDRYRVKQLDDVTLVSSEGDTLALHRIEMRDYMLDLLDGLRDEMGNVHASTDVTSMNSGVRV